RALGVRVTRDGGTEARIDGLAAASLAELSQVFAVQAIEPGAHRLIEEGASRRRRWLDWAVFHVEPSFLPAWSQYTRALRQRNASLRLDSATASVWEAELARWGEVVAECRQRFVERLQPVWTPLVQELAGLPVEMRYARGWPSEVSLASALADSRDRDLARGTTQVGPHRADLVLRFGRTLARDTLSRGQQKLVAIALTLAQVRLLSELTGTHPTLLLDDPAAELDRARLAQFAALVSELACQIVVTSLQAD